MRYILTIAALMAVFGTAAQAKWLVLTVRYKSTKEVMLQASETGSSDSHRGYPGIVVACRKHVRPTVLIHWVEPVFGSQQVRVRFDGGKPRLFTWDFTSDGWAGIMPRSDSLLRDLLTSKHLLARVEPRGRSALTAEFDTRGLRTELLAHPDLCSLPPKS